MKEMITSSGERHGLINTVANSVEDNGFKHMTPENKAKAEKIKADECKIVKARYLNSRGPNERLEKPYMHWAGSPIQMWRFIPGEVYEVPKGLVDEVNDPNKIPVVRSELLDSSGTPSRKDTKGARLHEFVPISF